VFLPLLSSVPSVLPPQDLEECPAGRSHDQKPGGPRTSVGQGKAGVFRLTGRGGLECEVPVGSTWGASATARGLEDGMGRGGDVSCGA
jgi:hypothetical protein